jgi:prepilin-type N-terminal cleavage/methylation domain-containing protein
MEDRGGAGGGRDHRRRAAPAHHTPEAGFTLIELVIAVSIFAIMTAGIVATISSGLSLSRNNRNRSVAANLAAERMDELRAMDFATLEGEMGKPSTTKSVGGSPPYTITTSIEPVQVNSSSRACDANGGSTSDFVFRVDVRVTWPDRVGVTNSDPVKTGAATASTIISPPVGLYDQTGKGFAGVKVLDADGNPSADVPVTLTPAAAPPNPNFTDSFGCAFFSAVPGTYTVSLGTAGWVDRQGNQFPTQTFGIAENTITQVGFDYAQAASIAVTLQGADGAPVPASVPLTLGDNDFAVTGTKLFAGSGTSRTIGSLFPVTAGYTIWAGDCSDADPQGTWSGGPFWSGAQRGAPVAVTANGTSPATVTLPAVQATVLQNGLPLAGVDVVAVHQLVDASEGADAGCPSGETWALGTTDANGIVSGALPFGLWQLQVTGQSPVSDWPVASLAPPVSGDPTTTPVTVTVL